MGIESTLPTSRRGYLSQDELEQFANITISDSDEADDQISQAEEMIDAYVGFQERFLKTPVVGRSKQAGGSTFFYLDPQHDDVFETDYFKFCEVEIIGGTGAGQRRRITANVKASGKVTVANAWTVTPDTTSAFRIYQLGKFPRHCDVTFYTQSEPYVYYKAIPEAIKRAVAAQVEYIVEMGTSFFAGDKTMKESETISRYSYTNAAGVGINDKMIAPKARILLKGLRNRTGSFA